jgi:hypothetical protein
MWEPAVSGTGNVHDCTPKLQAYLPIFSLTPKASGSTRLQSCEDRVVDSHIKNGELNLCQNINITVKQR